MVTDVDRLIDRPVWWHVLDATRNLVLPFAGFATMVGFLVTGRYSAFDVSLFAGFFLATGLGITVGWHRLFSHRAFKARPWLRATLAVLGSFAWQRPLFVWVVRHRLHHARSDQPGDFHSPYVRWDGTRIHGALGQFLHAHYLWLHWYDPVVEPRSALIRDLYEDRTLRWVDRHYDALAVASVLLPGLLAAGFYGTPEGFVRGVVWGGLARIFVLLQIIWFISSVTHFVGKRRYATGDASTNSWVLGWLALGEGYHNNHHAFPSSPRFGLHRGELDVGWLFIRWMHGWKQIHDLRDVPDADSRARRSAQRVPLPVVPATLPGAAERVAGGSLAARGAPPPGPGRDFASGRPPVEDWAQAES